MCKDDVLACIDMLLDAMDREIGRLQGKTKDRLNVLLDLLVIQIDQLAHKQDVPVHGK